MRLPRTSHRPASGRPRRGAALMLSFLVLIILILIVSQISYSAKTDARVSRNEEALVAMDQAIESVLLQVYEDLKADAEGGGGGGGGEANPFGGEEEGANDSREDDWARPQRTEMNDLQIRILVQDEDSKLNVLSILTEDEEQADRAFERLTRVIELSRAGTRMEIDGGTARQMATTMLEYMNRRRDQLLPVTEQLSQDPENDDIGLPLTLREFAALDPTVFTPDLFRDLRDEDDNVVHSLSSFLTVHSSLSTFSDLLEGDDGPGGGGGGGVPPGGGGEEGDGGEDDDGDNPFGGGGGEPPQEDNPFGDVDPTDGGSDDGRGGDGDEEGGETPLGGGGTDPTEPGAPDGRVNVNTAPPAVLRSLMDDRDVPSRFWDKVVEYRNEPQEDAEDGDEELPLDEFGEEIVPKQFFSSLEQLEEVDGYMSMEPVQRAELSELIKVQSSVFSIYVTARRPTGEERVDTRRRREDAEREEAEGQGLVRTVRSVVWRRTTSDGGVEIVPLVRWEEIDYVPYEVLDIPRDER